MKSNRQDWSKVELTEKARSRNSGYIATRKTLVKIAKVLKKAAGYFLDE